MQIPIKQHCRVLSIVRKRYLICFTMSINQYKRLYLKYYMKTMFHFYAFNLLRVTYPTKALKKDCLNNNLNMPSM